MKRGSVLTTPDSLLRRQEEPAELVPALRKPTFQRVTKQVNTTGKVLMIMKWRERGRHVFGRDVREKTHACEWDSDL